MIYCPRETLAFEMNETEICSSIINLKAFFSCQEGMAANFLPCHHLIMSLVQNASSFLCHFEGMSVFSPTANLSRESIIRLGLVLKWHGDTFVFTSACSHQIPFIMKVSWIVSFSFSFFFVEGYYIAEKKFHPKQPFVF